jgi:cytochrome b-561
VQVHPVLMLIGFIITGSEGQVFFPSLMALRWGYLNNADQATFNLYIAIMSYKTLPWSHDTNKMVHLILHAVALFLGSFGVYAAFKFHNESGIDNLYSLHSWVGLGAIILYGLQVILINCYHLYIQILKIVEIDMTTVLLHLVLATVNLVIPHWG